MLLIVSAVRFCLFRLYMEPPKHISTEKDVVTDTGEKLKKGFILGKEHRGMVHKNKTGKSVPQHFAFHLMTYPESYVDYAWDLIEAGEQTGVLTKQANTYYFGDEKLGGSRARSEDAVAHVPALAARIETAIRKELSNGGTAQPDADALPGDTPDQELQGEISGVYEPGSE